MCEQKPPAAKSLLASQSNDPSGATTDDGERRHVNNNTHRKLLSRPERSRAGSFKALPLEGYTNRPQLRPRLLGLRDNANACRVLAGDCVVSA
ncbi:hypothetical protein V5799_003081 [Amblyomma americanum]|uniref:Uncharacterized protein n=1 Tax=Amblyomma americanum TaxID=6943 RepID=A0AAQ4D9Z7_AMBAM